MTTIIMRHASPIHDVTVQSVSLRGGEMDPKKFFPWIEKITQTEGPNILRLKGIIAFKDDPDRYVVQGVHMIMEGDHQRAWKDGEKHESRLVFIGRKLDEEKLEGLEACQAACRSSPSLIPKPPLAISALRQCRHDHGASRLSTDADSRSARSRRPLRRRRLPRRRPAFRAGRRRRFIASTTATNPSRRMTACSARRCHSTAER